jgi:hypothetical protein
MSCFLPFLAVAGCADYLNHNDTVTAAAGNAVAHNKVVHITDPWPPAAANTRIEGNGQRVDRVTKRYLAGPRDNNGASAPSAFVLTPASSPQPAE